MSAEIPPGTLVIVAGRLCQVIAPQRIGAARGYAVIAPPSGPGDGHGSSFAADYGWRCSACPTAAGVNHQTAAAARRGADKHAGDHSDAKVVAL